MSNSLSPLGFQDNRLPCSSLSWTLLRFMSIVLVMLSNHLILCCPLFFLPSIFPSIRIFCNELAFHIRWTSASVLPMNIQGCIPLGLIGLIFLLSKGLSRVFSSISLKASILWPSAFFVVQLLHLYMTTVKTITLMIWTFLSKVMSLTHCRGFS